MGGLWRLIPVTYALMWIGSLALAGIWPFAGFYSKDFILEAAWGADTAVGALAFWLGVFAAFLTAFYSWRLLILTFHGRPHADESVLARVHESPRVMLIPMMVLAVGAIVMGFIAYGPMVGHHWSDFWRASIFVLPRHPSLENAHEVPLWVQLLPLVVGLAGVALAYVLYVAAPHLPRLLAQRFQAIYRFLLNKWYFDELYDAVFVRPAFTLGRGLWKSGDGALIDGVGPDGVAAATVRIARGAVRLQTGYIFHYAFAMLIGVLILVTWYLFRVAG
jgi:NADH-quinone oxidoreductase subunit L